MDMVIHTSVIPRSGESVIGKSYSQRIGGKGTNQAVALARLGVKPIMFGSVGGDACGEEIIAELQEEGIVTKHLQILSAHPTGIAFIMLEEQGDNRIIALPGANLYYDRNKLADLKKYLNHTKLFLLQLEMDSAVIEYAIVMAYEAKVPIILNPGPICPVSDALIRKIAYLTPNETEAEYLTGVSISNEKDARKAAEILLDKGAGNVIITLGSKGALVANANGFNLIPAYEVSPIDTVAAGDTFNGALAVELSRGASLLDAVKFSIAAAAIAVTREGSASSIPYRNEVIRFMQNNKMRS